MRELGCDWRLFDMTIEQINPLDYLSYNNVVVQCGINDLVNCQLSGPNDVKKIFKQYKAKIDHILALKQNINIFICPLLPTRSIFLVKAVNLFNSLLWSEIIEKNYRCTLLAITGLSDDSGLLEYKYSKGDRLHLNFKGRVFLAMLIKKTIFLKYNSGKNGRISSNRPYSDTLGNAARGPTGSRGTSYYD